MVLTLSHKQHSSLINRYTASFINSTETHTNVFHDDGSGGQKCGEKIIGRGRWGQEGGSKPTCLF
jgi:hypothetical protein